MARSSGGGSRSGGSSSSRSSRSSSGGGSRSYSSRSRSSSNGGTGDIFFDYFNFNNSNAKSKPFAGAKKFKYTRGKKTHYLYSKKDLTKLKDAIPRWLCVLFMLPLFLMVFKSFQNSIVPPIEKHGGYSTFYMELCDEADVFTETEENLLYEKQLEFGNVTGIQTVIVTTDFQYNDFDEFSEFALDRYYEQFPHEYGWLLVYTEENDGNGEWYWEGIQGDSTIKTMNVFIDKFNRTFHSNLVVNQTADPFNAFVKAFDIAINEFENQKTTIDSSEFVKFILWSILTLIVGYFLVFFGVKKYSYNELEEVDVADEELSSIDYGYFECKYCGYKKKKKFKYDIKCPNCDAISE